MRSLNILRKCVPQPVGVGSQKSPIIFISSRISADVFSDFLGWLYTKAIPGHLRDTSSERQTPTGSHAYRLRVDRLLKLHFFAREHEIPQFAADTFDVFRTCLIPHPSSIIVPSHINLAYEILGGHCGLGRLQISVESRKIRPNGCRA